MILAVDVGNTETVIGAFHAREPAEPVAVWRLATDRARTGDELALALDGLIRRLDGAMEPERLVVGSVVPVLKRAWSGAARSHGLEVRFLDGAARLPIRLEVDHPAEVGADRIANTLAAADRFGRDTIVVDLGTATTFDCITADGAFMGGAIAPGPQTGLAHLTASTAQLPHVELGAPDRVIGRNTLDCLRSGGFYTVVDGIDGMIDRILEEWSPEDPVIAATGGLAELFAPRSRRVDLVVPALTISGLAIADRYL